MPLNCQLTALNILVLDCSRLCFLENKFEKQKGEHAIFSCGLPLQSVEHVRSFRGNLTYMGSLQPQRVAGGNIKGWDTWQAQDVWFSLCYRPVISASYLLSWEIVLNWTKNIKYNFRLLLSHDIISIVAEKVLSTLPETNSMEQSVNNMLKRWKVFSLPNPCDFRLISKLSALGCWKEITALKIQCIFKLMP